MASSSPGEYRPAFFGKGLDTPGKIRDRCTDGKTIRLAPQLRIETVAERGLEQRLGSAMALVRPWPWVGPAASRAPSAVASAAGDEAVDKAQFQRPPQVETITEQH